MKVLAICLALGMIILLLLPANSYATHKSEKLSWQLVFISSYSACSNYQYQMTSLYNDIAKDYLDLYQLENTNHKPVCITDKKYATNYHAPDDLDLIILVYDRNLGRAELHSKQIGGFYYHTGNDTRQNHAIVFCDCPNFQYSDPVWILTHELSHFALYYMNFDDSITEDYVHVLDANYDYCIEVKHDEGFCSDAKTHLESDHHAYSWTVMKPYKPPMTNLTTSDKTKLTDPAILKEITRWWADSKITDEDYWKIITMTTGKPNQNSSQKEFTSFDSVLFTDPPKDKKKDLTGHVISLEGKDAKTTGILNRIQFKNTTSESTKWQAPQWLSYSAHDWLGNKISDNDFVAQIMYMLNPQQAPDIIQNADNATKSKEIIYSYHWKKDK